jgi:hypothetical protein
LLVMARSPTLAAARPAEDERQAHVIQGYARVRQQALAREGRAPWFLAGLAVYADLAALRDSLARCLRVNENPRLRLWQLTLTQQVQAYAADFAVVRQAQAWLEALCQTLDALPLPTLQLQGAGGDAAARQVAATLGQIADQTVTDPWLGAFRQDLFAISKRYWAGLFVCYDIVGLPRTNNALESLFGQTKRQTRRQNRPAANPPTLAAPGGLADLSEPRRHGHRVTRSSGARAPPGVSRRAHPLAGPSSPLSAPLSVAASTHRGPGRTGDRLDYGQLVRCGFYFSAF